MSCSTSTNRYPANLDFEKELDAVLRSSKTLAYKSSATDKDKVISHKTFLTFIDQAVAKNAEELIFKFCNPRPGQKLPASRSTIYTCLTAINKTYEKVELNFESALWVNDRFMYYISSNQYEGYFGDLKNKSATEINIEENYIKIFLEFSQSNPNMALTRFGDTKGVMYNLGVQGKCMEAIKYFARQRSLKY